MCVVGVCVWLNVYEIVRERERERERVLAFLLLKIALLSQVLMSPDSNHQQVLMSPDQNHQQVLMRPEQATMLPQSQKKGAVT